uniref:Uncharacterized protein n=1 Tax=viral metagenome TaxID=1070528 RepID=A0A6C0ED03_9ZZZZ
MTLSDIYSDFIRGVKDNLKVIQFINHFYLHYDRFVPQLKLIGRVIFVKIILCIIQYLLIVLNYHVSEWIIISFFVQTLQFLTTVFQLGAYIIGGIFVNDSIGNSILQMDIYVLNKSSISLTIYAYLIFIFRGLQVTLVKKLNWFVLFCGKNFITYIFSHIITFFSLVLQGILYAQMCFEYSKGSTEGGTIAINMPFYCLGYIIIPLAIINSLSHSTGLGFFFEDVIANIILPIYVVTSCYIKVNIKTAKMKVNLFKFMDYLFYQMLNLSKIFIPR